MNSQQDLTVNNHNTKSLSVLYPPHFPPHTVEIQEPTCKNQNYSNPVVSTVSPVEDRASRLSIVARAYQTIDYQNGLDRDPQCTAFPIQQFDNTEYIRTPSGSKISLQSTLHSSQNIYITGRCLIGPGTILHGDLAPIHVGKYVILGNASVLSPATDVSANPIPMTLGDYIIIGQYCVVKAASIESGAIISDHSIIGNRCILKNHCVILPDSVVPPDTTVPSFCMFGGTPARFIGDLHESAVFTHKRNAINLYGSVKLSV